MKYCIDASLALKWLIPESESDAAIAWLAAHTDDQLIAPAFFAVEVASVLRRKTWRNEMSLEESQAALSLLQRLNISLIWDWSILQRAVEMAEELGQPTVYDTAYLALAQRESAELWTADMVFQRMTVDSYPFVHTLP